MNIEDMEEFIMDDKKMITITLENGTTEDVEVLLSFKFNATNKEYLIYTKNETDDNGNYINNESNSINIDIKFMDNDQTYRMETLYNNGIDEFMQYYNNIKFKCMQIDYHKSTGNVSYMYIEQISV